MRAHSFYLVHYGCLQNIHSVNYTVETAMGCEAHNKRLS